MAQEIKATLRYLHIAPRKTRLVANALKGLSANEAEAQLLFRPQRSSLPILKLLRSAVANAKNNFKLNQDNLVIKSIRVDQGPMLKRFMPRAMGRATPIHKKMSHVFLILEAKDNKKGSRFVMAVKTKKPAKKEKSSAKIKNKPTQKETAPIAGKPAERSFLRKIFNRKSV